MPAQVLVLLGGKYVRFLDQHLHRLRKTYDHGNRTLFYDQLASTYLLAFFNPTLRSLRTIEDISATPEFTQWLNRGRVPRSTMSDANALMDPRLLEPIIAQLRQQIPALSKQDRPLWRLLQDVVLVDGSFFAAAADVAYALGQRARKSDPRGERRCFKMRLDMQLDAGSLLPRHLGVHGKGTSEAAAARKHIEPGCIYVLDRGYVQFPYLQAILDQGADFVLRLKSTEDFAIREEQVLDEQDRAPGVLSDRIGQLVGSPHCKAPRQMLRDVVIFDVDHPEKPIRILTSLLAVPEYVIADLYRWRWQLELFFRWLKVDAHFEHLLSHNVRGMTLGFYVAVIAVLLIYLHTGRSMSKYAYNALSWVACGWATVEQILPILERREKECQRDRERQARRRAEKTGR